MMFLFSVSLHDVTSAHASGSDNTGDSLICFATHHSTPNHQSRNAIPTPNIRTFNHHSSNPKPHASHPRRKRVHVAIRGGTGSFLVSRASALQVVAAVMMVFAMMMVLAVFVIMTLIVNIISIIVTITTITTPKITAN